MSDIKTTFIIAMITVTAFVITALLMPLLGMPQYPQATGIFPQAVSCVNEKPDPPTSDRNWKPTVIVAVEPGRDPGQVKEYQVLGCRLYYYHNYSG